MDGPEKRSVPLQDPDYEDTSQPPTKRRKLNQEQVKENTVKKIERIFTEQFDQEISSKKKEVYCIDQRLDHARVLLDRLRACLTARYYSKAGKSTENPTIQSIHPAIRPFLGKTVPSRFRTQNTDTHCSESSDTDHAATNANHDVSDQSANDAAEVEQAVLVDKTSRKRRMLPFVKKPDADEEHNRAEKFKTKQRIVVGNVSRFIPSEKREANDPSTHKWMVYVRGSRESPVIDHFVDSVLFFLHPSYKPNDLVKISEPPFHLTRRGWGVFPVRVQLHFVDKRNKPVDIIHQLKLDKTYTGLQTLGAETVYDISLERDKNPQLTTNTAATENTDAIMKSPKVISHATPVKTPVKMAKAKQKNSAKQTLNFGKAVTSPDSSSAEMSLSVQTSSTKPLVLSTLDCDRTGVSTPPVATTDTPSWTDLSSLSRSAEDLSRCVPTPPPSESPKSTTSSRCSFSIHPPCNLNSGNKDSFSDDSNSSVTPTPPPPVVTSSCVQTIAAAVSGVSQPAHFTMPSLILNKSAPTTTNSTLVLPSTNNGCISSVPHVNSNNTSCIPSGTLPISTSTRTIRAVSSSLPSTTITLNSIPSVVISSVANTKASVSTKVVPSITLAKGLVSVPQGAKPVANVSSVQATHNVSTAVTKLNAADASGSFIKIVDNKGNMYLVSRQKPVAASPVTLPSPAPINVGTVTNSAANVVNLANNQNTVIKLNENQSIMLPSNSLPVNIAPPQTSKPVIHPITNAQLYSAVVKQSPVQQNTTGMQGVVLQPRPGYKNVLQISGPTLQQSVAASPVRPIRLAGGPHQTATPQSLTVPSSQPVIVRAVKSQVPAAASSSLVRTPQTLANVKLVRAVNTNQSGLSTIALPPNIVLSPQAVAQTNIRPTSLIRAATGTVVNRPVLSRVVPGKSLLMASKQNTVKAIPTAPQPAVKVKTTKAVSLLTGKASIMKQPVPTTAASLLPVPITPTPPVAPISKPVHNGNSANRVENRKPTTKEMMEIASRKVALAAKLKGEGISGVQRIYQHISASIRVDDFENYGELVEAVVPHFPIVKAEVDRSVHPYCAKTMEQYMGWTIAKRRASERMRCVDIRRTIVKLLEAHCTVNKCRSTRCGLKASGVWNTWNIVEYCRRCLHTPLDNELTSRLQASTRFIHPNDLNFNSCTLLALHSSSSPPNHQQQRDDGDDTVDDGDGDNKFSVLRDLLSNQYLSTNRSLGLNDTDDTAAIDVDSLEDSKPEPTTKPASSKSGTTGKDVFIPPSNPYVQFIRDSTAQVGVSLKPQELDGPGIHSYVLEDMMLKAMECFVQDLMRHTTSHIYNTNRMPDQISALDVYKMLVASDKFDFVTNSSMAERVFNTTT